MARRDGRRRWSGGALPREAGARSEWGAVCLQSRGDGGGGGGSETIATGTTTWLQKEQESGKEERAEREKGGALKDWRWQNFLRPPTSPFWAFLPCSLPHPLSGRWNGNPACATTSPVPNSKQLSMSPRLRCCLPPEMRDAASPGRHPRPKTSSKTNQPPLAMFRGPSPAPIWPQCVAWSSSRASEAMH